MANRRAMKLFAATILAGASPATASPAIDWASYMDTSMTPRTLRSGSPAPGNTGGKRSAPARADRSEDIEQDRSLDISAVVKITPRMLMNRRLTNPEHALLAATHAYQHEVEAPIVLPRLLANARPACGNTGGKVDRPSDCTEHETRAALAADKMWVKESNTKQARIDAAYTKLIVATEAAVASDPSLQVRLLHGARPACGNTMSKAKRKCDVDVAEVEQ